jgi:phosphonate transport system substrate-binding protein
LRRLSRTKASHRRLFILALGLFTISGCGQANDTSHLTGWRKDVGEIRMGYNSSEDSDTTLARWTTFSERLGRITGLKVSVFEATDYNGIIQAMASGQLELASFGASSYANAREQMGEKVEPMLASRTSEGLSGYYSTLIVRADSPYKTIDDLAGKTIGYVDFNSTSGYLYPRMKLKKEGKDPDTFFGKSVVTGGHSQGVLGLANGQFDAVFANATGGTPEIGFSNGSLWTLARNGLVKLTDYRVIWTAGPIAQSPYVIRTDRPQAFQDITRGAIAALAYEDPNTWTNIGLLEGSDFKATSHKDYVELIELRRTEIGSRRNSKPASRAKP